MQKKLQKVKTRKHLVKLAIELAIKKESVKSEKKTEKTLSFDLANSLLDMRRAYVYDKLDKNIVNKNSLCL